MKTLIVSPHPDDEIFHAYAFVRESESHVLFCSNYDKNKNPTVKERYDKLAKFYKEKNVSFEFANLFPSGYSDTIPIHVGIEKFDCIFKNYERIIIPYEAHHQDHTWVYQACLSSLRHTNIGPIKEVLMYDYIIGLQDRVIPDYYKPISPELLAEKIEILLELNVLTTHYLTQDTVYNKAVMTGRRVGLNLAESFKLYFYKST